MQSKYIRLFAMTTTLALALAACQMETSPLKDGGIKESVETQQPALQNPQQPEVQNPQQPEVQKPQQPEVQNPQQPEAQNPQQPEVQNPQQPEVQNPQQEDKAPTNDFSNNGIVLGVTQVQVQFDPDTGSLHYPDGSSNSNPINLLLTTGYTVSRPQATPYRAGYKFRGWVQKYPVAGLSFDQANPWDFDTTMLTESMTLYAYFEDVSDQEADAEPKIVVQQTTSSSRVYSLEIDDVPDVTSLGKTPDDNGLYTLFAADVTKNDGWFNSPQYMNHCWATSSSQMIYWYQNQLKKLGKSAAVGQPETIQELRDWFANGHSGFSGWHIQWALEKYFKTFYPNNLSDITTYRRDGYYFSLKTLSDILLKHLSRGDMCGLTAENFDGGLHAMNIYGAQFNKEGIVETLYVTSSPTLGDDEIKNRTPRLYEFKQDGHSWKGAQSWKATYDISKDGYTSTTETAIQNIYGLDFLSVKNYK